MGTQIIKLKKELPGDSQKDYSLKENQIGCGYCVHENSCTKKVKGVNMAKLGCKEFKHFSEEQNSQTH